MLGESKHVTRSSRPTKLFSLVLVCEFTFTWLSKYKRQTKHMNEYGFQLFLLDMAWSHNEIILQGSYRPEDVAGSLDVEDVA